MVEGRGMKPSVYIYVAGLHWKRGCVLERGGCVYWGEKVVCIGVIRLCVLERESCVYWREKAV